MEHFHERGQYQSFFLGTFVTFNNKASLHILTFTYSTVVSSISNAYTSVDFGSVMEGEASFPLFSPETMVMNPSFHPAVCLLPPIRVFHGKADFSIPHEAKYSDVN